MSDLDEEIGSIADDIDSLLGAMNLRIPWEMHKRCLQDSLARMRDKMRAIVVRESGENPWGTHQQPGDGRAMTIDEHRHD